MKNSKVLSVINTEIRNKKVSINDKKINIKCGLTYIVLKRNNKNNSGDVTVHINGKEYKDCFSYEHIMLNTGRYKLNYICKKTGLVIRNENLKKVCEYIILTHGLDIEPKEIKNKKVETKEVETKEVETKEVETKEVETKEVETKEIKNKKVETKELPTLNNMNSLYKLSLKSTHKLTNIFYIMFNEVCEHCKEINKRLELANSGAELTDLYKHINLLNEIETLLIDVIENNTHDTFIKFIDKAIKDYAKISDNMNSLKVDDNYYTYDTEMLLVPSCIKFMYTKMFL